MDKTVEQKDTAEQTEVKAEVSIEPELTMKDVEQVLDNVVNKAVEKLNVIDKSAKLPVIEAEKPVEKSTSKAEEGMKVKQWFKDNLNKGWSEKGLIEGTGSSGATVAVPVILQAEILRQMNETGVVRQFGTKIPMTSETLLFTVTDTEPEAIWGTTQGSATDSTAETYTQVTFTRHPLVKKTAVSNPLLQDASGFVNHLAGVGASAIRKAEDRQAFTILASASNTNEVILTAGTLTQGALTFAKVSELINKGTYERTGNERLFMHRSTWSAFQTLTTSGGFPVAGTDNWQNPNFKGIPVSFVSSMTDYLTSDGTNKVYAIYCDLSKTVGLGVRNDEQVAMRMSDSAVIGGVSMWDTDQTAIKYQVDEDVQVLRPRYVTKLTSAH